MIFLDNLGKESYDWYFKYIEGCGTKDFLKKKIEFYLDH